MDKNFRRDFSRWLNTAKQGELFARRDRMYEVVRTSKDADLVKLAKWGIAQVNLELDARGEAAAATQRYRRWKEQAA